MGNEKDFDLNKWREDCFDRMKRGEPKIVFGQSDIAKKYLKKSKEISADSKTYKENVKNK